MQKPSFSDNHPIWSASLTGVMVIALILGFWMVLHRQQQSLIVASSTTTPSSQPTPASSMKAVPTPIKATPTPKPLSQRAIVQTPSAPSAKESAPAPSQPSPQQPTYGQTCVGAACAQGPGSQATYNQFGGLKYTMTDSQRDIVRDNMGDFAGVDVVVECVGVEPDTIKYAANLAGALEAAHMNVHPTSAMMTDAPSGIFLWYSDDNSSVANALAAALIKAGLVQGPVNSHKRPGNNVLTVAITPQR